MNEIVRNSIENRGLYNKWRVNGVITFGKYR